jgi:hypothetical protein
MAPPFIYLAKVMAEWPKSTLAIIAFLKSGLGSVLWWGVRMLMLGKTITGSMATGGATAAAQISAAMTGNRVVGGGMNQGSQGLAQMKGSAEMTKAGGMASKDAGIGSMKKSLGSAAQILAVGAALMMLAKAVEILANAALIIKTNDLAGVMIGLLVGITAFVGVMGLLGSTGIGEAAILIIDGIGFGLLMIGGAVFLAATGMSILVDSFTNLFAVVGENGSSAMMAGAGFLMMAAGIGVLTFSLIAMGAASILALPGLLILGGVTSMLVNTAESLNNVGGSKGLTETINAINRVDQDKLDALKSLTTWMALLGGTTTIKFDEGLTVGGEITIKGEGSLSGIREDLLTHSGFMSDLKNAIIDKSFAERNGGKAGAYNKFA